MGIETAIILAAAGTAISAAGSMQAAKGMKAAGKQALSTAEYNKKIRDRNARVADQEADLRERVGGREEREFREDVGKLQATAGTAYRKGNVMAGTGTPLTVMMASANEAEEDVQTLKLQASTDAGRMRAQGVNQRLAGQLALLEGRSQKMAYDIQARAKQFEALTTVVQGGSRIAQIA